MIRSNRPLFLALTITGSVIVGILLVFILDRVSNGAEVLGDVTVAGVELGGLGEAEARDRIATLEEQLAGTPIPVVVAGHRFELDTSLLDVDIDEDAIIEAAMRNGRDGSIFSQFGWWLGHFVDAGAPMEAPFTFEEEALADALTEWQTTGIANPAHPGAVGVEAGRIVFSYPQAGTGIEMDTAMTALESALTTLPRPTIQLATTRIEPGIGPSEIDAVVADVTRILDGPVTLTATELGRSITIPRSVLAEALLVRRSDTTVSGYPEFAVTLLGEPVLAYVRSFAAYLETPAVDAEIQIDDTDDSVTIVPSVPVTEPDPTTIAQTVWEAANSPDRTAELAYRNGREAALSTEMVEAFGIREKISEFTTFHSCCQARVINIQRIADQTDGAWVLPGETFSLNDHVGKRTVAGGYVCAGALIGGEVVEEGEICVGGGTSQFTTTLYNAVFFAGLEDVYHFAHTIWFSRYPEGREATLGFPGPDIVFRNNTDSVVVIKTSYTSTSITVKMFGDNGGIDVQAGLSGRYNHTQPRKGTKVDTDIPICTNDIVQAGTPGWTVDVYRYITYPDGTKTTEVWTERYEGYWELTGWNPTTPPSSWGDDDSPCAAGGGLKDDEA